MQFTAQSEDRLDKLLAGLMPEESRSRLTEHIAQGHVQVDGVPGMRSQRVHVGQVIEVAPISQRPRQTLVPFDLPLEMLYEDEYLLVVNKPPGLATHPAPSSHEPTLVEALLAHGSSLSSTAGDFRPGIVHRLDKDTSGALLVAKTDPVHRALQLMIQQKSVGRRYTAWVRGIPDRTEFVVQSFLGRHPKHRKKMAVVSSSAADARQATTHCALLASVAENSCGYPISRLSVKLETGRTHQIRVHLSSVGLPVLGDSAYGVACELIARQALHASELSFAHPVTSETIAILAPVPADLKPLADLC